MMCNIRYYVKWGITSYRWYGNSDLDKTYLIWNFGLSLVQLWQSIFCPILDGGTVVDQSIVTQKPDRAT